MERELDEVWYFNTIPCTNQEEKIPKRFLQ